MFELTFPNSRHLVQDLSFSLTLSGIRVRRVLCESHSHIFDVKIARSFGKSRSRDVHGCGHNILTRSAWFFKRCWAKNGFLRKIASHLHMLAVQSLVVLKSDKGFEPTTSHNIPHPSILLCIAFCSVVLTPMVHSKSSQITISLWPLLRMQKFS